MPVSSEHLQQNTSARKAKAALLKMIGRQQQNTFVWKA